MNKFYFCTDSKYRNSGQEHCPGPKDKVAYFTQITLNGCCEIPEPKPDSEKLVDWFYTIEFQRAETACSEERIHGHQVRGKKVVVAGILQLGIEYSELCPDQKVHFFQCDIPFTAMILRNCNGEEHLLPENFCLDNYLVHACVEHIQVHRLSPRKFEPVIVMMIWLQPQANQDC